MVYWLQIAIVRLKLVYIVVVWWAITQVKRFAMKITPRAAIEALLNLSPIPINLEREVKAAECKITHSGQWKENNVSGFHTSMITSLGPQIRMLPTRSDKCTLFIHFSGK